MGIFYRCIKVVVTLYLKTRYGFEIREPENVPKAGAFIVAANHISNLDPPAMCCSSPRELHTMAKKELFEHQPTRWVISRLNGFPVSRGELDMAALRKSLNVLKEGCGLLLFPEGTRRLSADPQQYQAKAGVGMIAMRMKVPIVPAGIRGTHQKSKIIIRFGEPILPESYKTMGKSPEAYQKLTDEVMRRIKQIVETNP